MSDLCYDADFASHCSILCAVSVSVSERMVGLQGSCVLQQTLFHLIRI